MTDLLIRCETERPSRPQHSAEILNGRKIEEVLVKQVRCAGRSCVAAPSSCRASDPQVCSMLLLLLLNASGMPENPVREPTRLMGLMQGHVPQPRQC